MRLLFGVVVLVLASPVTAASSLCDSIAYLARAVMESRQGGAPMVKVMNVAKSHGDASLSRIGVLMVEDAYEHPSYSTEKAQQRAVQEFEDKWYLQCHKAMKDKH